MNWKQLLGIDNNKNTLLKVDPMDQLVRRYYSNSGVWLLKALATSSLGKNSFEHGFMKYGVLEAIGIGEEMCRHVGGQVSSIVRHEFSPKLVALTANYRTFFDQLVTNNNGVITMSDLETIYCFQRINFDIELYMDNTDQRVKEETLELCKAFSEVLQERTLLTYNSMYRLLHSRAMVAEEYTAIASDYAESIANWCEVFRHKIDQLFKS